MRRFVWSWLSLAMACTGDDGEQTGDTTGAVSSEDEGGETAGGPVTGTDTDATLDDTGDSGDTADSTGGTTILPDPLPPLDAVPTTVDERIVPTHAIDPDPVLDPRVPDERQQMLDEGYGAFDLAAGEAILPITPDGTPPPAAGAAPSLLSRFVHLADTQIADDESPLRLVTLDNPVVSGAFRPQEDHGCQLTNAAVRTINAVNAESALDFVVLGGDNADAAQTNEVSWFLGILDGAPVVHCDSGFDDDPEAGEDNDPKDRFAPVGLDVPWIWVTGNHDVLVQGNFVIAGREETAVGEELPSGGSTRDWSMPGGPAFEGPVVADPERALLDGPALMALVAGSGDGHGITPDVVKAGRATYGWDAPGSDLRIIVVDTAAPTGAAEGLVTDADVDALIRPALDAAEADGRLVIVATHHASTSLGDGSGLGGMAHPDALDTADWQALLGEYPNVIAHLCGHSHEHRARFIEPVGGGGYWEIITAAIADWPHQMRIVELHDQDNGWLTITGIALDFATDDDPLAADGRALGILDYTGGWTPDGLGLPEDRNVQLWIEAP